MKKAAVKHKQSRHFTIMLVPDSSAKVRKVHIPYWVLSVLGIPFLCILVIVVLFQIRVLNLESLLDNSAMRLSETLDAKGRLTQTLVSTTENPAPRQNPVAPPEPLPEPVPVHSDDYEQRMTEMLDRIGTIDEIKHGIISIFKELAALDIPFDFDEDTLSGGVVLAQGGAYTGSLGEIYDELEIVLSNDILDMLALSELAEELEAFFRARPTGWPVQSRNVVSEFGYRTNPFTGRGLERHDGLDVSVPIGTRIYSTAYGVVTQAGWNSGGYGYVVVIDHGYDYSTLYAHNSVVLVEVGDEVTRGQLIALSGNTGRSAAPHCHYEVRLDGLPQNPRGYLE
jgi:murein DD-endopeptidase MepM/ murein hydrolase activator NlpD